MEDGADAIGTGEREKRRVVEVNKLAGGGEAVGKRHERAGIGQNPGKDAAVDIRIGIAEQGSGSAGRVIGCGDEHLAGEQRGLPGQIGIQPQQSAQTETGLTGDGIKRVAGFDDGGCRGRQDKQTLSDGKAVRLGQAVAAGEKPGGDAIGMGDGKQRFAGRNHMNLQKNHLI